MERTRQAEDERVLLERIASANAKGEGYCLPPHQDKYWYVALQRLYLTRKLIRWVNRGPQKGCWLK